MTAYCTSHAMSEALVIVGDVPLFVLPADCCPAIIIIINNI